MKVVVGFKKWTIKLKHSELIIYCLSSLAYGVCQKLLKGKAAIKKFIHQYLKTLNTLTI